MLPRRRQLRTIRNAPQVRYMVVSLPLVHFCEPIPTTRSSKSTARRLTFVHILVSTVIFGLLVFAGPQTSRAVSSDTPLVFAYNPTHQP